MSFSKGFGASATGEMAIPNRSWPKTPRNPLGMLGIDCPHDLVYMRENERFAADRIQGGLNDDCYAEQEKLYVHTDPKVHL